jgi:hypothetical protein
MNRAYRSPYLCALILARLREKEATAEKFQSEGRGGGGGGPSAPAIDTNILCLLHSSRMEGYAFKKMKVSGSDFMAVAPSSIAAAIVVEFTASVKQPFGHITAAKSSRLPQNLRW